MIDASVLVVGGGAIGGVTAAKLTGAVRRVAVLDANREHVERLRGEGLRLDQLGQERRIVIEAHADPDELDERFDFALVTLKAAFHEAALAPLRERDAAECFVSLGNGLVQDRIAELVGAERLIAGHRRVGRHEPRARDTSHRRRAGRSSSASSTGRRASARSGCRGARPAGEVRVSEDIRSQIWAKLLVNSVFSGLGAVAGLLYEDVVADRGGPRASRSRCGARATTSASRRDSSPAVCSASTRPRCADPERAEEALAIAMDGHGATKASMLQDLERGVPTEVDVIDGAVVERGRRHGVATPLHEGVVDLIHAAERGERDPRPTAWAARML